ncbi:MAG: helix-turn-helix domain-containing protein [Candidatus Eisenbacteria bacterium]|nr:helix-turn-helix domain-containing protein [Candidatus Eisenbacteria bacterium]
MLDKAELGKRVKVERLSKGMTLKQVAEAAGMSPTHISEIERGRTSPTVGALLRIAHALGRSATFFVEEERLPTVSIVRGHERVHQSQTESGRELAAFDYLTKGIPAGRLRVARISSLSEEGMDIPPREGEEILLVNSGRVRVTVDAETYDLSAGDAVQFKSDQPHHIERVGEEEPDILWITAAEGLISP